MIKLFRLVLIMYNTLLKQTCYQEDLKSQFFFLPGWRMQNKSTFLRNDKMNILYCIHTLLTPIRTFNTILFVFRLNTSNILNESGSIFHLILAFVR